MRCANVEIDFFFQAEDGIRDLYVTGVQTCALPISGVRSTGADRPRSGCPRGGRVRSPCARRAVRRSEERRVGKECRSRWLPNDSKNSIEQRSGGEVSAEAIPIDYLEKDAVYTRGVT